MTSNRAEVDAASLPKRVRALPGLDALREAAAGAPLYLVGGAVRDLLLGAASPDLDVVVEGDAAEIAQRLGGEALNDDRFHTARASVDGHDIDLATARRESYERPGALPKVEPAGLEQDLGRRDFTINSMAVSLSAEAASELIDPHGGLADLRAGLLRVLHPRSFEDDPTRALRAARYCARLDLGVEPETEALLRGTDLSTVSSDRIESELRRLAFESEARRGFELLAEWGLFELPAGAGGLIDRVQELTSRPPWSEVADRATAVRSASLSDPAALAEAIPKDPSPSEAVAWARRHEPLLLVLARATGAEWLDRYLDEWRDVGLEIDGDDLIAAGIPQGAAVGRGLQAALRAKLDGEIEGREQELARALDAARETG